MPTLSKADMTNRASSGPYAGQTRIEIFHAKIRDKKPFTVGTTKNGFQVTGVSYDNKTEILLAYRGSNKTKIEEYKRTKIFKDKEMGGGGGSGGGAEDTKYTESMQCYYCSYVFNIAKKQVDSVSWDNLKKGERFVQATKKLKDCIDNGPVDWVESDVYIKTANKLYEEYGSRMRTTSYWHRDSRFMQQVYAAKKMTHKIDKSSGDPQAPGSFSDDKWNPGDIWASTLSPNATPLKEFTSSWGELNAETYRLAQKGELLGISLKKVGPTAKYAKLTEFSTPELMAQRSQYRYEGVKYGRTGNFFSSQDIYVNVDVGEVQFRTFGGETSWQGEIKGKSAAGGKIGGGNVHFYCKNVFKKGIYGPYESEKEYLSWIKRAEKTGEFQERMYELYSKWNSITLNSKQLLTQDDFITELAKTDYKFKNSKAICLEFMDTLLSGNSRQRDEFITKMFRYAQSDTDQSSYFVKLY